MDTEYYKIYQPDEERDCVSGDIVGIAGDAVYPALIVRKEDDKYEGIILERLDGNTAPGALCKPGQMFILEDKQILTRLHQVNLTVKQIGDEDHLDFDEEQLKSYGFELPQL